MEPTNLASYFCPNRHKKEKNKAWWFAASAGASLIVSLSIPMNGKILGGVRVGFSFLTFGFGIGTIVQATKVLEDEQYSRATKKAKDYIVTNSLGAATDAQLLADDTYWMMVKDQIEQRLLTAQEEETQVLPPDWEDEPPGLPADNQDPIGLIAALLRLGVNAKWVGEVEGASFRRCRIKLNQSPKPQKIAAVKSLAEDLAAELGLEYTPFVSRDGANVAIDIPRSDRQTLLFSQFISFNPQPIEPIQIAVGINLDGELIYADLSDADTCHFLVGGTTGSGKTEFLKSALASLIWRYPPQQSTNNNSRSKAHQVQ